ncbi:rhodanese-related sulfurtransferase [Erysipelothrix inopinata]|uniref:tRNA uridine(34) hydroxylase n=1 Tax=Erysipelothrix inopinata TaxID=225084 RepID=A0A7G9S170_9FIRM|nr:rhodanese-related sulfurtransferase [Erysipelothrix inopinata]QNN61595.1 rhodanese-related sulfurtransferase [Erysipelothrix inopinata]
MEPNYRVLLYYQYVTIENPEQFKEEHLAFCNSLGIKGRIIVSHEGINGTVSGTIDQTQAYMDGLHNDVRFKNLVFKQDLAYEHAFDKMHVRFKPELVNLKLEEDVNPLELTGTYLEPVAFYEAMKDENTVIIDARNDYEFDLGHFQGAIKPDIKTFRELPQWIKDNDELLEGKKILTYCTGGVRCEKFSGWLKAEGHDDVGQLHGGIVTYGYDETVQGELWDGACYVFDKRLSVPINRVNPVVVGKDILTLKPSERYLNCANPECNKQIIMSEDSEEKTLGSCCRECMIHPRNRYVLKHHISKETINQKLNELPESFL